MVWVGLLCSHVASLTVDIRTVSATDEGLKSFVGVCLQIGEVVSFGLAKWGVIVPKEDRFLENFCMQTPVLVKGCLLVKKSGGLAFFDGVYVFESSGESVTAIKGVNVGRYSKFLLIPGVVYTENVRGV